MEKNNREIFERVRNEMEDVIEGAGEIRAALIDVVSRLVARTCQESLRMGMSQSEVIRGIIRECVRATLEVSGDLELVAQCVAFGILRGTRDIIIPFSETIKNTASSMVQNTEMLGGDTEAVAKAAVEGIIEGAREIGLGLEETVSLAASAAVKTAYEFNSEIGNKVRSILSGTFCGIRVILKENFRSERMSYERRAA